MDPEHLIGIEEIDRQHETLLERMEYLRDAMRRGQSREAISETLKFLDTFIQEHFATEVRYMQRRNYPGILLHKAEHEVFLKDFAGLKEKYNAAHAQGDITPLLLIDIVRKLNNWFTNHIATVDRKMGDFFSEKRQER